MLVQNLFELYKTFNKIEIKNFHRFLKSPYFNQNKNITVLFEELSKYHPRFDNSKLSKQRLYKVIYKSDYNDSTMRNLYFRLLKMTEKFLIVENMTKNKFESLNRLLGELNGRAQKDIFRNNARQAEKLFEDNNPSDGNFFYNAYLYDISRFNHSCFHDKLINKQAALSRVSYLNNSCLNLMFFFLTELLDNYIYIHSYFHVFNISENDNAVSHILRNINLKELFEFAAEKEPENYVNILYRSLLEAFFRMETEDYYFQYKNLIEQNLPRMNKEHKIFHYLKLISYCLIRQNLPEGKFDFKIELFNLYNDFLNYGYNPESKTHLLQPHLFRSILFLAINLKELNWAKFFIDKYSERAGGDDKQNIYNYGCAFYNFEIKNYDLALECSNKVSFDLYIYKYDIKNLKLRILFMKDNFEETYNLLHSYKELVRIDDSMPQQLKTGHKNFLHYFSKLFWYKEGKKTIDLGFLRNEIRQNSAVLFKDWLLENIDLILEPYKI